MDATVTPVPSSILQRTCDRLAGWTIATAAFALLMLVLVQGWQVIARYVLNDSPSWTEPVTLLMLSTAMSMGAAAGVHTGRHFAFSLLADAMGPRAKHVVHLLQSAVVVVIGLMLSYWGGGLFVHGAHIPTAGAPMPEGIDYLPLAVGGALVALFAASPMLADPPAAGGH